ncbi:glycoside hydrolase family 15 protein [Streptomyces sp. GESEQ-35]|uniref:glycoside hydrolase family 15 protein n=1 Tax=Streptomyces sp. GESEQ-35 TaxID=2812657 RepID=UPI001B33D663|nr:glycoside hydrolase family 15 protein [Streptomyces sp. GESEQ-35]
MVGRIEDYALIGDLETAALVGRDGAIDWLCMPRFDSPACFAALLGTEENGQWRIAPAGRGACNRRSYRGTSLVLESVWEDVSGAVRLTDFMPPRSGSPHIVRIVEGISGRVAMRGELRVRFHHGSIVPWTRLIGDRTVAAVAGPDAAVLFGDRRVDVSVTKKCTYLDFSVSAGERIAFVLNWSPSHRAERSLTDSASALSRTLTFWNGWTAQCGYRGPYQDAVVRSLVILKALTYEPTGGIVAAVTASLPECIGGERNWDYRFCWLRDSTFTLSCLLRSGFHNEAMAWKDWLVRAVAGEPAELQTLYGVAGQRRLPEEQALWLPGYEGSAPVRFGNGAVDQFQLDVYGEVLNSVYSVLRAGVVIDEPVWNLIASLMEHLDKRRHEPDEGIWEVRGPRRHFVHSKVMSWVAADRAVRMARVAGLRSSAQRWRTLRNELRAEVCREGWDDDQQSFVQCYGGHCLDATALLIPRLGFLPADDGRVLGTVRAMRKLDHQGFLKRYSDVQSGVHDVDGMRGGEGAFLACTLWYADALAMTGRQAEARTVYERVLDVRNDVGMLSEEWDPVRRRHLGNTPQALSHVALVNTTFTLFGTRQSSRRVRAA